ncbi:hypothetical protein [Haliangium sp.]|uniref:hypothetical protein n=1 Tax=Haliangium sp. TaxID=2663208 RepID=UPI003D12EF9F
MKTTHIASLCAAVMIAVGLLAPTQARAEQVRFSGPHPIPEEQSGEFCYIEWPHVHVYEPAHAEVLYRDHDGYHHFVGDPVAYGYDGPTTTYYGHHPVQLDVSVNIGVSTPVTEYCYLDGPHFHHYAPPPGLTFELKGGAFWYIGKYPRHYRRHKKKYAPINVVYEPIEYARPEVVVEAPVGYVGPVVDVHVDAPAAGAAVRAGIEVEIPVPSVEINVGLPGVIVHDPHHHHHGKFKKHRKHKRHKRRGRWRH